MNSGFNNISNVLFFDILLSFDYLVLIENNFLNFSISSFDSNNFLFNGRNFFDSFMNNRNLNGSLHDLFNNVIDLNNYRVFNEEFYNFGYFNNFLFILLDLVDLRNVIVNSDKLLDNSGNFYNSISGLDDWFSDTSLNLFDDL